MKKLLFLSLFTVASVGCTFAQQATAASKGNAQFTKAELLAFPNLQSLLGAIDKKDYSKYLIRNFALTTTATNADNATSAISETGPGGKWSEKQKEEINKYATKGAVFTLEKILMLEPNGKGVTQVAQPDVSFSIKE
ncbi:MAG: hypothetical protein HY063_11595 [Bacteroidetes bacterium]|nr:hypothetical protein [Bacteroidota bacterium]